ncbi:MAG: hypothetical protein H6Q18_236 [Bacteroidetes bacterium]|nr:hypothetical protein [Bacteroidota bacterium]
MQIMKAKERQTFIDLAIQACGSPEAAFDFALLNGVSLTDDPGVGVELAVPPVVNTAIATYYANKKLYPATGFTGEVPVSAGIGYWAIEIDFIVS